MKVRLPKENLPYPWPPLPGRSERPVWTGKGFCLGDAWMPILQYEGGSSGWTEELTFFHEETAGEDHFIDKASREHALEQLHKYVKGRSPVILEVGCSSGFLLRSIRENMPQAFLIGADCVSGPLLHLARRIPDVALLQFDLTRCPLPDGSVDAVVLLNVLEHIEKDQEAVNHVYRILRSGGIAVLEVPAGPHLYDVYDQVLMHHRRYSLPALRRLVEAARLRPLEQSHLGFFLYPGFWWVKRRNRGFLFQDGKSQRGVVAQNITRTRKSVLLTFLLRLEMALGRWASYPLGIRCLMTCRKEI